LNFENLPKELRQLVGKATAVLGQIIKEYEGENFYNHIEYYRKNLKKTRQVQKILVLQTLLSDLKSESQQNRQKIAHAFSLQLELVNVCEAAYRTWRQQSKTQQIKTNSKLKLTYVLTAHPTEARSKVIVDVLSELGKILVEGIQKDFLFNENELESQMRMLWLLPFSKTERPSVADEAEYIYSLVFAENMFDFILENKSSYDLKLRSWVGGDKDGHPNVNKDVMRTCFSKSRKYILAAIQKKLQRVRNDIEKLNRINSDLNQLISKSNSLDSVTVGDGTRVKDWISDYRRFLKNGDTFIKKHSQILLINRLIEVFPAFVFPIELREDSDLIRSACKDESSIIRGMLIELSEISGTMAVTCYAGGFVVSHCESADDLNQACRLVNSISRCKGLSVIPLFETKEALEMSQKIVKTWLEKKSNFALVKRYWFGNFEIMLGYSDSAKQTGALASRYLIAKAMADLEETIQSFSLTPKFFHGSGGSVDRGGGSLKEQIAWWSNAAVANPKFTIQGEMIQRNFATREILNSQCIHLANEALARRTRSSASSSTGLRKSPELKRFVEHVEKTYSRLVNDGSTLKKLLDATPYRYLDILKIGSRPSKRPDKDISIMSLRAIPWVLCWTQTRVLMPTWWGIGTAWHEISLADRKKMKAIFKSDPFFSSFVKTLGFSLAKVELEIWQMYFTKQKDQKLFKQFNHEYRESVRFVKDLSSQKSLIWDRPWLEASIQMRSSNIHILNLLQILALEASDEALLKETIVGIACGMLTTG